MQWREINRKPVHHSVRLYPGLEGSNSGYALAAYKVEQCRIIARRTEWRQILEDTPPLFLAAHPELDLDVPKLMAVLAQVERACFFRVEGETLCPIVPQAERPEIADLQSALVETRNVGRSFWKSLLAHDDRVREDYATWIERNPWLDEDYEEEEQEDVEEDARMV